MTVRNRGRSWGSVAAAERDVASANVQIGVAQSAWFPSLTLRARLDASSLLSASADLVDAIGSGWDSGQLRAHNDGVSEPLATTVRTP